MATFIKRANAYQAWLYRAIAGAVANAAHAHKLSLPNYFAHSVAKRAAGTISASEAIPTIAAETLAGLTTPSEPDQTEITYLSVQEQMPECKLAFGGVCHKDYGTPPFPSNQNAWRGNLTLEELYQLEGDVEDAIRERARLGDYDVNSKYIRDLLDGMKMLVGHAITKELAEKKK